MKRKPNLKRDFPRVLQGRRYTCAPACFKAILQYYGARVSEERLSALLGSNKEDGTTEESIIALAQKLDIYVCHGEGTTYEHLKELVNKGHPVMLTFVHPDDDESHYAIAVVVNDKQIRMSDPDNRVDTILSKKKFIACWYGRYHGTTRFALVFKKL